MTTKRPRYAIVLSQERFRFDHAMRLPEWAELIIGGVGAGR